MKNKLFDMLVAGDAKLHLHQKGRAVVLGKFTDALNGKPWVQYVVMEGKGVTRKRIIGKKFITTEHSARSEHYRQLKMYLAFRDVTG